MTQAWNDVLAERNRQINEEGWTPEHDDQHPDGDLERAAACYCTTDLAARRFNWWPWEWKWWKPKSRRENLVRAAALLLAAIERLDRKSGKA